jgi:hypothetical protein
MAHFDNSNAIPAASTASGADSAKAGEINWGNFKPRSLDEVATLLGIPPSLALLCHGFVNHDGRWIIRQAELDAYLIRMGALWTHGECKGQVLTTPMLPGIVQGHLRPLRFACRLIEVARPDHSLRHGDAFGFAGHERGLMERWRADKRVLLASLVSRDMSASQLSHTPRDVSLKVNSKPEMRRGAGLFGFRMAPGGVVRTLADCERIWSTHSAGRDGEADGFTMWLKADGSGSDFVRKVRNRSELPAACREMIQRIIDGMRTLPDRMIIQGTRRWIEHWEDILTKTDDVLRGISFPIPLVLEVDASVLGEFVASICWQALICPDGTTRVVGHSDQILSPDGSEWWGSKRSSLELPPDFRDQAERLIRWYRHCGYSGFVGPDAIIVRDRESGELQTVWIDPNGRAAMSTTAFMVSNALLDGKGGWINTNLTLSEPVDNYNQLHRLIGGTLLDPDGEDGVQGVVLATRTEPGEPSPVIKLWLGSRDGLAACEAMLRKLQARGVKIGS